RYEIPPHIKPNWQVWYECVLPEDRQHAEKVIRDSLQSRSPFKLEFRITVKDGIRHIRALANRVLNKEGEVERLLGINMDMTEVKQLNEALFQEKERLRSEEHTSELQSRFDLVCRLLLAKKNNRI